MNDPHADDVHRWWHLSEPSAELRTAQTDAWIRIPGVVIDLGWGLGTEIAHLATAGWRGRGIDLSPLASFEGPSELMHGLPRRLQGANDLEVLVDEDVVRPVDADVVDVVLAVMVVPL
jgi:SAM-dependent methyltransferase